MRILVILSLTAVTALGSRYLHANVDDGEEQTILLITLKTPYLLNLRIVVKDKYLGRDTSRLRSGLMKINRTSHALVPYKQPVTLWLSDDAGHIPIKLRASVYIGDVGAILTDFSKNP